MTRKQESSKLSSDPLSIGLPLSESPFPARWLCVVFAIAVLSYISALGNGLVWDDHQLLASDLVTGKQPLWKTFVRDYWNLGRVWSDSGGYYRPLTVISLRLDYLLGHGSPLPFHITALLIHGITSLAVYPLAIRFGASKLAAQAASIFFAVHPHQTETVAWISGRPDLLMAAMLLWSLALNDSRRSLALGACAMLSKETAIVWPILCAIRDRRLFNSFRWKQIALVVAYLIVRALVLGSNNVRLFDLDLFTGIRSLFLLLGTWLWPLATAPIYAPISSWASAPSVMWLGLLLLLAFGRLFFICPKARPALLVCAVIHAPAALLMCSRAVLGMRPLYAASAFLIIAVCIWASVWLQDRSQKMIKVAICFIAVLAISCGITARRWSDDLSFNTQAAATAPKEIRIQINLALAQRKSGHLSAAWQTTQTAQALGGGAGISLIRGQILETVGCAGNALGEYRDAITLSPEFAPAYDALVRLYVARNNFVQAAAGIEAAKRVGIDINIGTPTVASSELSEASPLALCSDEESTSRFVNLNLLIREGTRWIRLQRLELADIAITAALHQDSTSAASNLAYAQLQFFQKHHSEAILYARKALSLDPRATPPALKILGLALLQSGQDPEGGKSALRRYLELVPNAADRAMLLEQL